MSENQPNGQTPTVEPRADEDAKQIIIPGEGGVPTEQAAVEDREVMRLKPAALRRYPLRFAGYSLLVAAALVGVAAGLIQGVTWLWPVSAVGVLFVAYRLIVWNVKNSHTEVVITNHRVSVRRGATTPSVKDVPHQTITELNVIQSAFNRLFDVGDLTIVTSKGGNNNIQIRGIRDPEKVAWTIRDQVRIENES